jgi:predicted transcriptional regulator
MKRVSIFLSPEQIEQLNRLAVVLDRPVARLVRQAVDQLLAQPPESVSGWRMTNWQRDQKKKSLSK